MSPEEAIADEWRSRLRRQEESLDEVRRRAAQGLAASLLIAGLFIVGASDPSLWQIPFRILAVWSLVSLVAIVACIEWPRTWEFNQDTDIVSGLVAKHPGHYTAGAVAKSMTSGMKTSWTKNQPKLETLHTLFSIALLAAGAQAVFWILAAV